MLLYSHFVLLYFVFVFCTFVFLLLYSHSVHYSMVSELTNVHLLSIASSLSSLKDQHYDHSQPVVFSNLSSQYFPLLCHFHPLYLPGIGQCPFMIMLFNNEKWDEDLNWFGIYYRSQGISCSRWKSPDKNFLQLSSSKMDELRESTKSMYIPGASP